MKFRTLLLAAAAFTLISAPVHADTIKTTTMVKQQELPGVQKFDIKDFDSDHDGVITVEETGDHLFDLFDLNHDDILDNIEFTKRTILTVIPVKEETFTFRDFNSDGKVDASKYAYSTYIKKSGLYMFDEKKDGLSPDDFVNASFLEMDKNNSHVIEPAEWREAYIQSRLPESAKQYRYNN